MPRKKQISDIGFVDIPVCNLCNAPWNYKGDDDAMAAKLAANVRRNGLVMNLVVRDVGGGSFEVCDGNHRLSVLRTLGVETAMCYNVGSVSETEAKRIAVEMNETRFRSDPFSLATIVKELQVDVGMESLKEILPFTHQEYENLIKISDSMEEMRVIVEKGSTDFHQEYTGMPEYVDGVGFHSKVVVFFACYDDRKSFFDLLGERFTDKTKSVWYPHREKDDLLALGYVEKKNGK